MNSNEYLNEERYQKTNKKLFFIGIIIIIVGITAAMIILIPKVVNGTKNNKEQLQQKLNQLKPSLEKRYQELKSNGVNESWDYKNKDGYEMYLINIAMDPTYEKCEYSSGYSDNETTREYCKIKADLYDANNSFANGRIMFSLVPALMLLMPCLGIGLMLIMTSKRRNIAAYYVQQTMPVAKEGIEKMAPTIGKVGSSVAKEMAPAYGEIAKEVGKGLKEGMKDEEEK